MYTDFVACVILNSDKTKVFYCHKNKPSIPYFHGKVMAWGGHVESFDKDNFAALIRELKEELDLDVIKEDLTFRGTFYDEKRKHKVDFFTLINNNLKEQYVENEGFGKWEPINLHQKHPEKFLETNLDILDKIFSSSEIFKIRK